MESTGFEKRKGKERKAPACSGGCLTEEEAAVSHFRGEAAEEGVCCVKVLGAGYKSCGKQYENAKAAVMAIGLPIEVEYITDMPEIMKYGVMNMPALVVNEKVVSAGRVLKAAEVEKLLRELGF